VTTFTYSRQMTIEWGHCDPAGIVFNSRFFEFFDTNSWFMLEAALGVRADEIKSKLGIIFPLVGAQAVFHKPAKFNDTIEVISQVAEFRRSSFEVAHRITVDGALAVEGSETRVWAAQRPDDPDKIAAVAIPPDVIAKFG
jgi:4-hydroxybenzoyl-CoA thioesterase